MVTAVSWGAQAERAAAVASQRGTAAEVAADAAREWLEEQERLWSDERESLGAAALSDPHRSRHSPRRILTSSVGLVFAYYKASGAYTCHASGMEACGVCTLLDPRAA